MTLIYFFVIEFFVIKAADINKQLSEGCSFVNPYEWDLTFAVISFSH